MKRMFDNCLAYKRSRTEFGMTDRAFGMTHNRHPEHPQGDTSSLRSSQLNCSFCIISGSLTSGVSWAYKRFRNEFGMTGKFGMTCFAFTLAEVLITLAIIGVVAALTIPSVISNSQQQEFKTGLRKAVSVLNSAITMNMAIDGESPYDNANLYGYLMKHMNVIETVENMQSKYIITYPNDSNGHRGYANAAFYTTDGMRFEFYDFNGANAGGQYKFKLYETDTPVCRGATSLFNYGNIYACGGCGSYGLNNNTDRTTKPPCLIMVDVNGDRKPNPENVNCRDKECAKIAKFSDPNGKKLTDLFTIMITDKQAIPYGVAAQKAMYSAQK